MADQKVTALDALATVADADILYVVDDVGGTATSKKITRLNLLTSAAIGGTVEATTLTDGTMTITGGDIASVGTITATTITDGTMSITGGDITSVGSITATTITDGTASISSGAITGIASATDGTATWTGGATNTLAGFASVSATTLTDGTATISAGAISTTGTLGCSTITMTQNSDTVEISHDGTDAYFKTSDGYFVFQTDEGTNTETIVWAKGKGTGAARFGVWDGSNDNYKTFLQQNDAVGSIIFGSATTEFVINKNSADVDFRVEGDTNANLIMADAGLDTVGIGGVAVASQILTLTQNSDTIALSHDGTDAYMKWSDGYLRLETDEGTNGASYVWVKGKGTGLGALVVQDGSNAQYYSVLQQADAIGQLLFGTAVTSFVINDDGADVDFRVESDTITHAIALDAGTNAVTLSAPNSATTPAANGTLSFWIDETGHNLKVAVKYADGTAKTATVAFD